MRYLMHVITVGCIDIYEYEQESFLDIHLKCIIPKYMANLLALILLYVDINNYQPDVLHLLVAFK